jgi:selenocysteine lyase/cysteine desulfurase
VKGAALSVIPAVASFSGYKLDIAEFAREAHAHDVPVLVDAFQATGTYPIDVKRADVDFLVTGVYKWLLAPAGLAFLYVRPDHHALAPTTGGWYAAADQGAFDPLDEPAPDARRFQYGGPSIVACVAATGAIELLLEVGLANIERHNARLIERIATHARERKWEIVTPESRASIITFRVPDQAKALAACARENVVINPRLGGLRVSPHFYNTEADVDRLFDVLDRAL